MSDGEIMASVRRHVQALLDRGEDPAAVSAACIMAAAGVSAAACQLSPAAVPEMAEAGSLGIAEAARAALAREAS